MLLKTSNDFFNHVNQIKDKKERVTYIRENANIMQKEMININFNPNLKFLLPPGKPDLSGEDGINPYKKLIADDVATLNFEIKKMYLFIEGGPNLNQVKRETLWVQLLNSLSDEEADDLTHVKDKQLHKKYKKITHDIAYGAFPEFVCPPPKKQDRDSKGRFNTKSKKETA